MLFASRHSLVASFLLWPCLLSSTSCVRYGTVSFFSLIHYHPPRKRCVLTNNYSGHSRARRLPRIAGSSPWLLAQNPHPFSCFLSHKMGTTSRLRLS